MTQENKELLLKDICARLPYGVKVKLLCRGPEQKFDDWIEATLNTKDIELFGKSFKNIKPYLRPMSSMTEEEHLQLVSLDGISTTFGLGDKFSVIKPSVFDWLNAHHFDYRGLIEKGLAIAVTEDNNPYNYQKS